MGEAVDANPTWNDAGAQVVEVVSGSRRGKDVRPRAQRLQQRVRVRNVPAGEGADGAAGTPPPAALPPADNSGLETRIAASENRIAADTARIAADAARIAAHKSAIDQGISLMATLQKLCLDLQGEVQELRTQLTSDSETKSEESAA